MASKSKKILFCFVFLFSFMSIFGSSIDKLTAEQINSVNILNYLTVLMTDINNFKNNKPYLDEVYSSLLNNTNPKVDYETQQKLTSFLDSIEQYRNSNIKQDRLQFIYERNKNNALKRAIPNPIGLLSAVNSQNRYYAIASIAYMAVDSYVNYNFAINEAELEFIKDNWKIDDEFNKVLHQTRKEMFNYLIDITNNYNIPKECSLTEYKVNNYINWKNDDNLQRKIQWFESNADEYIGYANYYLDLAIFYYENKQYQECIDSISSYEKMNVDIFRKDYDYSKALMYGVLSLFELLDNNVQELNNSKEQSDHTQKEVYTQKEKYINDMNIVFENKVVEFLRKIINNINDNDWAIRYFVICSYVELSKMNEDFSRYLVDAYKEVKINILNLHKEQSELNKKYCKSVEEIQEKIPKNASDDQKKQIENSNKQMIEMRKKDLPPILYALVYNLDIYYELKEKYPEVSNLDRVLRDDDMLFYYIPYNNKYLGTDYKTTYDVYLTKNREVCIPLLYVQEQTEVRVNVIKKFNGEMILIDDFKIDFVERNTNDPSDFMVYYKSEELSKMKLKEKDEVEIHIYVVQDKTKQNTDSVEGDNIKYCSKPTFNRTWYTLFIGKKVAGYEKI